MKTLQTLRVSVPDRAYGGEESFYLNEVEIPEHEIKFLSFNSFGAEVIVRGKRYTADQEMMRDYPRWGDYYLHPASK